MRWKDRLTDPRVGEALLTELREVFAVHCTPRARKRGRTQSLSYGDPSWWAWVQAYDTVEAVTRHRLVFHVGEAHRQARFAVVRRGGRWWVDRVERFDAGWKRAEL